ncbi:hypothetical protein K466DRAFT_625040 [Polyporus arcularius HHB13444]|uniref:DUF4470 domain-containing protein n=1 Tax=Polyporus arcularius HHB13444 TaxID=1314778 RepID=A0A5C3P658_9APHY|nr:hypothetical protein K466DRAFT_625040 [Polyporus arcularius HHB13444]
MQVPQCSRSQTLPPFCLIILQAEADDSSNPVYPSSLSAALYEIGHYTQCVSAVLRASRLISDASEENGPLVARLSVRLANALGHGVRAGAILTTAITARAKDIERLRSMLYDVADDTAQAMLNSAWAEWAITSAEMDLFAHKRAPSLIALSRLPMVCKPLDPIKEFFPTGNDDLLDLTEGLGPQHVDSKRPSSLAFLFGGVGDARHVMSTLCGLSSKYANFPADKKGVFQAHLTLLDIHAATIARDLCIFLLLGELAWHTVGAATAMEIKATLMYIYCGVVMPSYCYARLQGLLRDLRRRLALPNPDLPFRVHVAPDTVPAILAVLDLWVNSSKSTKKMLDTHQNMDNLDGAGIPRDTFLSSASPEFRKALEAGRAAKRQGIKEDWLNMSDAALLEFGKVGGLATVSEARNKVLEDIESIVDQVEKLSLGGNTHTYEANWYNILKVFLPPPELRGRHPEFSVAWDQVQDNGRITQSVKRKALDHIHNDWKPNITIFDRNYENPEYFPRGDGYPEMRVNMFDLVNHLHRFNVRGKPGKPKLPANATAWDVCSTFFDEVVAALKTLKSRITLEFICGGLHEELAKIRLEGDQSARPKEFPKQFMRVWLSNFPDYTHGPLGTILYVLPNLHHDQQAAIASNSMMNMPVWKDDDEFMHTYTLLEIDDIELYLGCEVVDSTGVFGSMTIAQSMLPLPRPLRELATRDDLTAWLTRVLFNTSLPGRTKPPPCNIRLPHNLVAFFALILHVHRVGYPGHWLSDLLARVLSGRMVSDVVPYNAEYPIPVSCSSERVAPRPVRTDPWLIEFETIIATAYYAIPFPIAAALPADFSRDAEDIVVWQAAVTPATRFAQDEPSVFCSPFEPVTHLLFFRADEIRAGEVIGDMRDIFEGRGTPAPGTFFVLTAQEYVQYQTCVRFRLSRPRVERMRGETGWSMVAYRSDNGIQATFPAPISSWTTPTSDVEGIPTYRYAAESHELDQSDSCGLC